MHVILKNIKSLGQKNKNVDKRETSDFFKTKFPLGLKVKSANYRDAPMKTGFEIKYFFS